MTDAQKATVAAVAAKKELRALALKEDSSAEDIEAKTKEVGDLESRAAALAVSEEVVEVVKVEPTEDSEAKELRSLAAKANVGRYIEAALETRAASGVEGEYCEALGMDRTKFPLRLLAPEVEVRADTAVDAGATQGAWLDRIFADTAASYIGVTFNSVGPGVASYPVTSAGATGAQLGKGQDAADAPWTVSVEELKPKPNSVRAVLNTVDAARLGSLEEGLRRDLQMAIVDAVDKVILSGDDTANPADGDIVGLRTAAGVTEVEVTQAEKITGKGITAALAELIDGQHASMPEHLKIAASVGSNTLWLSTLVQSGNSVNSSIAQYLRAHGFGWMVREGIDTLTAVNDFGAYIGLGRMQAGAGVAAVWDAGQLIRDPYSDASGRTVALTLSHLWDFALPRPASFGRLKYVSN